MGKTISTNFSLRTNKDSNKTKVVADSRVSTAFESENFYTLTYTIDQLGTYLGEINDFLAVKVDKPIYIKFQTVDMKSPEQFYCSKLFINHGNMGKVWLLTNGMANAIATVWYSSDDLETNQNLAVSIKKLGQKSSSLNLMLRNLTGEMGIPLKLSSVDFKFVQGSIIEYFSWNSEKGTIFHFSSRAFSRNCSKASTRLQPCFNIQFSTPIQPNQPCSTFL